MLPDLPSLKRELKQILDHYLHVQIKQRMGVFNEAPSQIIHEGERMRIIRYDGSIEESDLKTASAELEINFSEVPSMSPIERVKRLNEMADEMAKQMSEQLFTSLHENLERAGQVATQGGKPFSPETILKTLEMVDLEFQADGQHAPMTMVIPPQMGEVVRNAFMELEQDPSIKSRYEELIMRKREEWRAREATRKLVG